MFGKRPRLNAQRERCDSTGMTAGASVAPFWKGKLGVAAGPTRVVPMATNAIATSEPMTGQMVRGASGAKVGSPGYEIALHLSRLHQRVDTRLPTSGEPR